MKTCSKCEGHKTLASFRKALRSKDGHDWWCKNCRSDYERARRQGKSYARRDHDVTEPFDLDSFLADTGL